MNDKHNQKVTPDGAGESAPHELRKQIQQARIVRGWTQAELAAAAGVHPSTIANIESGAVAVLGQRRTNTQMKVLDVLGFLGEPSDKPSLGQEIWSARRQAGMTQRQLAEELGVSPDTVSFYERGLGRPKDAVLQRIAQLFGLDVATLLQARKRSRHGQLPGGGPQIGLDDLSC